MPKTNEDLIMAMAEAHYRDSSDVLLRLTGRTAVPWENIPEIRREAAYDSMWKALHLLKEPTDEMLLAGTHCDGTRDTWDSVINNMLKVRNNDRS